MAERTYQIRGPDGTVLSIVGPDKASDDDLRAAAERTFGILNDARQKGWTGPGLPPEDWAPMGEPGEGVPRTQIRGMQFPPVPAAQPTPPAPPAPQGFFAGIREAITGEQRATPESRTMPEWTTMPELNTASFASFLTGLGTLAAGPEEISRVVKTNFPGTQIFKDAKGNIILRSSMNGRDYVIPPGATLSDFLRAIGMFAAFTPAGLAATIPRAIVGSAATQAAIEATQFGTGGEFDVGEVGLAAATGPAGQILQRAGGPVVQAARGMFAQAPAPIRPSAMPPGRRVEPTFQQPAPPTAPGAGQPLGAGMAEPLGARPTAAPRPAAAPGGPRAGVFAAEMTERGVSEVLDLARQAASFGPGSGFARARLAEMAQVNPRAAEAAQRLGIDVPSDVLADNPQVRSAVGLTRSLVAGEAEAAWEETVRNAVRRADDIMRESGAVFVAGRPATGVVSERIRSALQQERTNLDNAARQIYQQVDELIPNSTEVTLPNLRARLDQTVADVGEASLSGAERRLRRILTSGEPITYGALRREKDLIGKAIGNQQSPYSNMALGDLRRLYAALAQDQLDNVGALAGNDVRRQLRAANLMTAQRKALEDRIVAAFGTDLEGSLATRMQTAITSGARGDAAAFNRMLRTIPPELQRETLATALASVTASRRGVRPGGFAEDGAAFGFNDFAKTYEGLRANAPMYAQMVRVMGPEWDRTMRDLFEISRRINDAQSRVLTTGKANQILNNGGVTGLVGSIMSSGIAQRVATAATGMIPGGGAFAPDLLNYMRNANTRGVQAASELLNSPGFQQLAVDVATNGTAREEVLRRVALSRQMRRFGDLIGLPRQELDPRIQFLQSAIQTGRQFAQEEQQ